MRKLSTFRAGPPGAVAGIVAGAALLASGLGAPHAAAQSAPVVATAKHSVRVVTVVEDLDHPWGLAFLPDGRMLVTERPGRLLLVDPQTGRRRALGGLPPITAHGQGGALAVALHPRCEENRWIYLPYAAEGEGGIATEVARGRLRDDALADFEIVFKALPKSRGGRHFGSRLLFDREGHLCITLGERGVHEERMLEHALGRIRDVRTGSDDYICLLTDHDDGVIARLEPVA